MKTKMLCFAVAIFLASCTQVTVKRIDPSGEGSKEGIRYSLPKPFILVTPSHDGSVAVEVMMMPDPDNTYAIASHSFLSTYALDIGVQKGMLKRVGSKIDSTQVASDAIKASGAVTSEIFNEQVNAAKAKKEELKNAQNTLEEKETALKTKKKNLESLEKQLDEFRKAHPGSSTEIATREESIDKKEIEVEEADIARNAAKAKLDRVKEESVRVAPAATSFTASANNNVEISEDAFKSDLYYMAPKTIDGKGKKEILGPVLFTVDERLVGSPPNKYQTVELHAVKYKIKGLKDEDAHQPAFKTTAFYMDEKPKSDITGNLYLRPDATGKIGFILTNTIPDVPIANLLEGEYKLTPPPPSPDQRPIISLQDSGMKIYVDVTSMQTKISYKLVIKFEYENRNGTLDRHDWVIYFTTDKAK